MLDKKGIFTGLSGLKNIILDLGCGPLKKHPDWIGIDMLDAEGVDIVGDIYEVIKVFPDNSVDEVHAYHFFEHLPNTFFQVCLNELL